MHGTGMHTPTVLPVMYSKYENIDSKVSSTTLR
jgi:hypothetical protein